jgi:hypothetical protein
MHRKIMVRIACAALWVAALPAKADPVRTAQAQLPPYEILTIIRSTGLDPLSQPVLRGSAYVLRAIDNSGEEVRVVVDAHQGRILSVRPVAAVSTYEAPPPGYGPPPVYGPDPRYPPPYEYDSDAVYEPMEPAGPPPVIYGPRASLPASKPLQSSKPAAAAKKPAPAPRSAAVAPPKPAETSAPSSETTAPAATSGTAPTNGAAPAEDKSAPAAAAPALPPVQSFE